LNTFGLILGTPPIKWLLIVMFIGVPTGILVFYIIIVLLDWWILYKE